jgi:large subunit ribosomal protein L1
MKKDNYNPAEAHDPLDQNLEENTAMDMVMEEITDSDPVVAAEESAINTDTETALEATEAALPDPAADDVATTEEEPKKKRRESTSEKAKKAAAQRVAKGEPEVAPTKKLDPLRLRGKKYRAVISKVDRSKQYPVAEAIALVKELSISKFDGAVEVHIKVKGDAVRGTVVLPHGTGKTKKVAVADEETIEAITAGKIDFDVLIATPAQMPKLAKLAKVLGPKGLMPSPKAGTVTDDIEKVKAEISGGRVEYRADKTGVVHLAIGRISFSDEQLLENYSTLESVLISHKIQSISIAPTMGPAVKVTLSR